MENKEHKDKNEEHIFIEREYEEGLEGELDEDGFFYTPNGSFWDPDYVYFNREGFDVHGGHYDDEKNYIPGEGWDEENLCYIDELNDYDDDFNEEEEEEEMEEKYVNKKGDALEDLVDDHFEYAEKLKKIFVEKGIRVEADFRNEKLGYKIRGAQLEKVPNMIIVGDNEVESNTVSARSRRNGDLGSMSIDDYMAMIDKEIEEKIF